MPTEQGYSNQKKKGQAQFKTVHGVGSDSFGTISIPKYLSDISLTDQTIVSVSDVIGKDGQVQYWSIEITAHAAVAGNVIRIVDGSLKNFEFEVISVPDVDHVWVLPISPAKPLLTDLARVMAWVTGKADDEGNLVISQGPVQFKLDNVTTEVSKDTAVPANTIALPVEDFEARAKLTLLEAKDFATAAKQDTGNSSLSSIDGKFTTLNAKDFATSAKQDTGNSSLSSIDGKFTTLNAKDFATSAKQDTGNSSLSSIDGKLLAGGVVDPNNSSVTPLGIGAVFTGTAFEVTRYAVINVCVASDVASATDGVKVEFSEDGTNWDHNHRTTYSAATGVGYIFNAEFRYARVVYTNGAVAQAYFRLQTIFKTEPVKQSLYTIAQSVTGGMFAELGKNVIIGETTAGGGAYVPVKVTPSGALTVEASVTGSVSVSNFPATQPVSGSVSVSNFPATQPVSGSVSVSNFPATQNTAEQTQSGTITQVQKSVGLTAVRATVSGSAPSATRKKLMLKPSKNNTGSVYFGSSAVTTSTGMEIIGPDRLEFALDASDYYLISDTAGQVVEIVEIA